MRNLHRYAAAPAFIQAHTGLEEHKISSIWSDRKGGIINPRFVTLNPGFTPVSVELEAIRLHERNEERRVSGFNKDLAVAIARLRISAFVEPPGNGNAPYVEPDLAATGFVPLRLHRHLQRRIKQHFEEIDRGLEREWNAQKKGFY